MFQQERYSKVLDIYYYNQQNKKEAEDIFYIAMSLYRLNKYEEALAYFNAVIEQKTQRKDEALFYKAKSYLKLNRNAEAKAIFELLITNKTEFEEKSSVELKKM